MSFRDEQSIIDDLADRFTVSQLALAIYCRVTADAPSYSECSLNELGAWFSRRSYNGERRMGMGEHYSDVFDFAERDLGAVNPKRVAMERRFASLSRSADGLVNDAALIDAIGAGDE